MFPIIHFFFGTSLLNNYDPNKHKKKKKKYPINENKKQINLFFLIFNNNFSKVPYSITKSDDNGNSQIHANDQESLQIAAEGSF